MADAPTPIEAAKQFKKIEDAILRRNLMMEATVSQASFTALGFPGQEKPFKGHFTPRSDGKKEFWAKLSPESLKECEALIKDAPLPHTVKFSVFIREQPVICFETSVTEMKDGELRGLNPEKMFFLQRRQSRRYRVPAAYEIFVELLDPHYQNRHLKLRLFDISMGGISILVSTGESRFYNAGHSFAPAYITLGNQKLTVNFEVRVVGKNLVQLGEIRGYLVGCQFGKLDPEVEQAIEVFIEEGFIKGKTGRQTLE
jgi:c-di-GMP-binding flagellar brake protein YcgR